MVVLQSNPERMTEAFGLYALSGKATTFLAPAMIALATDISGSQRFGVSPLILLFLIGLILLRWVKPEGDRTAWSASSQ
jgi:UMF1 family MFS transporter